MSDPAQITDRMIARLEEANTRSYKQLRGANESFPRPEQDSTRPPSGQQPGPSQRPSRSRFWLFTPAGLLLAAFAYVAAFVWEPSHGDAAKLIIARWVNASVLPQPTRQNDTTPEPVIPPEVEQRLQRIEDKLANAQRRVEQLKVGQDEINRNSARLVELFKAGQEQMVRDNAKAVDELNAVVAKTAGREEARAMERETGLAAAQRQIEQLKVGQNEISRSSGMLAEQFKADREQMARDNAKVVDELNEAVAEIARREETLAVQLKVTQQQVGEAATFRSVNPARKLQRQKRVHRRTEAR